jgi:hypothetical protein
MLPHLSDSQVDSLVDNYGARTLYLNFIFLAHFFFQVMTLLLIALEHREAKVLVLVDSLCSPRDVTISQENAQDSAYSHTHDDLL